MAIFGLNLALGRSEVARLFERVILPRCDLCSVADI